ncbi:hypothetical protein F52700_11025 [Fusarium sp. NRRL 52700]|nr:hypothetical protein F52700_11025 [Fusarium sp. NRRL 52700]
MFKVEDESEAQALAVWAEVEVDIDLLRRGLLSSEETSGAQQRDSQEGQEAASEPWEPGIWGKKWAAAKGDARRRIEWLTIVQDEPTVQVMDRGRLSRRTSRRLEDGPDGLPIMLALHTNSIKTPQRHIDWATRSARDGVAVALGSSLESRVKSMSCMWFHSIPLPTRPLAGRDSSIDFFGLLVLATKDPRRGLVLLPYWIAA